jgi:hypothetical protein
MDERAGTALEQEGRATNTRIRSSSRAVNAANMDERA